MKKVLNSISIILFFSFILMFSVSTLFFQDEKLKISKADSEKSLKMQVINYTNNNFPLKNNWKSIYSGMLVMSGQNKIGDIYVADDRLVEIFDEVDYKGIERSVDSINTFALANPNIPMYAMIVPTASGIYSSQLLSIATPIDQQKLIDDIYYKLDKKIITMDAYNPLFAGRDDYIFFKTDNRWTSFGAYIVYSETVNRLGFKPVALSAYDVEYADRSFLGNLYDKTYYSGVTAETINIFKNKNGSVVTGTTSMRGGQEFTSSSVYYNPALKSDDKYSIFLNGSAYEKTVITTSVEDAPRLLIIKGNYANAFVPFLTPHYSEITMVELDNFGEKHLSDYVDINEFDQILFLYDVDNFNNCDTFNLLNSQE